MIVNQTSTGWELICQPAHALLSLQLAARWKHKTTPARWWETLHAVAQHDNGWQEWEQNPRLTGAGTPMNFIHMPPPDAIAQWERGVARAAHQSRWVGLLVSRHATSLYAGRKGDQDVLGEFLERQHAQQAQWMRELGVNEEEVADGYAWVRYFDWLSLVLCWRRLPENGSPIALGTGPDGQEYYAKLLTGGAVTVEPYPFAEEQFTVSVETRLLHQKTFADEELYGTIFRSARPTVVEWLVVSGQ